jgi:transcriptional regulator with XRE-family HTH domain
VPDESHSDDGRQGEREDQDRQIAELWQQILRQELQQRKTWRDLFESHERIIGAKVRQLRMERGWSQLDLAQRLDDLGWPLHQTNISKLEAGKRPIRVAEADALATAFGIPALALWYLPAAGEPLSIGEMRSQLERINDRIAELERAMQGFVSQHADYQFERMRLVQAINEAAKAAERGDLEELSPDDAQVLAEGMTSAGYQKIAESMEPGRRPAIGSEQLEAIRSGHLKRVASEAFRLHEEGASLEEVGQFVADSLPPDFAEPLRIAAEIVGGALAGEPQKGAQTEAGTRERAGG